MGSKKGALMEPRLSIITLGLRNLGRAVSFYRDGLGWQQSSASVGDFVIFKLSTGTAKKVAFNCLGSRLAAQAIVAHRNCAKNRAGR